MMNSRLPDPARLARLLPAALGLTFALAAGAASAAEAGRIVLVHGSAHVAQRAVAVGQSVSEGDEIATGKDGYVYLRTVDNGLLILRPSSRARIVAYHIDSKNPANTRIKLELLAGVARSVSGEAVKLARQNFRFNTPVAAIGVRGTDFTVYTDSETSRVTVVSGGIVVSGFGGSCSPEGGGPCEHATSRELFANQTGQMLQVARGTAVPQLMTVTPALAPDNAAPPRRDEPQAGTEGPIKPPRMDVANLDAQKTGGILQNKDGIGNMPTPILPGQPGSTPNNPDDPEPPIDSFPQPDVDPPEMPKPVPVPQLVWGRWQALADKPATVDTAKVLAEGGKRVYQNSTYAILRTAGSWTLPQEGTVGFKLSQSEASIRNESTKAVTAAALENGKLTIDFGASKFATSFDLVSGSERFGLQNQGVIGNDGFLSGESQYKLPNNMSVHGAVTGGDGMSAAYIFSSKLDAQRVATGITYWNKQ